MHITSTVGENGKKAIKNTKKIWSPKHIFVTFLRFSATSSSLFHAFFLKFDHNANKKKKETADERTVIPTQRGYSNGKKQYVY